MIRLFVNVDHVATIREARKTIEPSPLKAALLAEKAGAQGITIHLREDRRHIQDEDVRVVQKGINTRLNLEMAPTQEMVRFLWSRKNVRKLQRREAWMSVPRKGRYQKSGKRCRAREFCSACSLILT